MVVHVIGVPFDSAGTVSGVARAPAALRAAGLLEALRGTGLDVVDRGDVALGATAPVRDRASGLIGPEALGAMIRAVRAHVADSLRAGALPLVVGGDCPVLIGCLGAGGDGEPTGVLFVDGHEDAWPPHASTTGEAADMELGLMLGRAVEGLPATVRDVLPRLDPDRVVVLGARDQAELAAAGVASIGDVVEVIRTEDLEPSGIETAVADRAARLDGFGPWWLHVDLDVLSTASLAAVDYRQAGGLDWPVLTALTRRALGSRHVIGFDVTIYNPDLDTGGAGAAAIVRWLGASIGAVIPRPGASIGRR